MLLRRLADAVRRQDWFTVVIEFVIVVAGIYVGLEVSNWDQVRQERTLERLYLQDLAEDFGTNLEELETNEARLIAIIDDMLFLLRASHDQTPVTAADLNRRFQGLQRMPSFTAMSRTYDNLTGSGDLRLITSRDIKLALANYQREAALITLIQQTHEMELVETFQPYIIEAMDYMAVALDRSEGEFSLPPANEPDRILELLSDRRFRNILVQKWVICVDLLSQTRGLKQTTEDMIRTLNVEVASELP